MSKLNVHYALLYIKLHNRYMWLCYSFNLRLVISIINQSKPSKEGNRNCLIKCATSIHWLSKIEKENVRTKKQSFIELIELILTLKNYKGLLVFPSQFQPFNYLFFTLIPSLMMTCSLTIVCSWHVCARKVSMFTNLRLLREMDRRLETT